MSSAPPVVFIVFNRPDLTAKTLKQILKAAPSKLYLCADGPRLDHPEDRQLTEETRRAIDEVLGSHSVQAQKLYSEANLGLRRNYERAVTHLMQQEGEGIVLEDDTFPDLSFFPFCQQLLEKYRGDQRVSSICGEAMKPPPLNQTSYGFSFLGLPWAWATWQRAWKDYDPELSAWPAMKASGFLEAQLGPTLAREWAALFDWAPQTDSYWLRWTLTNWSQGRWAVVPYQNLVTNTGLDDRGTHTTAKSNYAKDGPRPLQTISFPLQHPQYIQRYFGAERAALEAALPFPKLKRRIKKLLLEGPAGHLIERKYR